MKKKKKRSCEGLVPARPSRVRRSLYGPIARTTREHTESLFGGYPRGDPRATLISERYVTARRLTMERGRFSSSVSFFSSRNKNEEIEDIRKTFKVETNPL